MDDIQTKIAQAKSAGYSDDEIAAKLSTIPGYGDKVKQALSSGYAAPEIIYHLSGPSPAAASGVGAIPGVPGADARMKAEAKAAPPEPSFLDKVTGGIEAARAVGSGLTTGALGYIGGGLGGIAGSIASGDFGTERGTRLAKEAAEAGAASMTYAPKTQLGQQYAQKVADVVDNSGVAGLPIGPELNAIGSLAKPVGAQVRAAAARGIEGYADQAMSAGSQLRQRVDNQRAMAGGGAAVADHYNMAEAAGATPDILAAIKGAGDNVHKLAAERHAIATSLPVPAELTAGQASGRSELASLERNRRGKYPELGDKFNRQDANIIDNFNEVRNQVAPDVNARGVDLGQMAVDAYKTMDEPIRADITAKYKALADANGGDFPLSGADFVNAADAALKKEGRARFVPAEVRGILDDLRDGGAMNFRDFENYRTILAEQARKAERAGDGTAKGAVNIIRDSLESLPMTNETAAIKPLADAARDAARERFGRIAADPAYEAAIGDGVKLGAPSPLADKFIKNYVVNGKAANVQNLLENLSNDPLNKQIISAGVIDHIKQASGVDLRTDTGNITQKGLNSAILALDKKAPLVLGDDVSSIVNKIGDVAKWQMLQNKGQFVNNSGTLVGAMAEGAKDLANGALDVKTLGATKFLRNMMDQRAMNKAVQQSIKPGAGINIADYPALRAEAERAKNLPPAFERPDAPVTAPQELALTDVPFESRTVAPYQESPSVSLMSLADDHVASPRVDPALAARQDYPSVDFPLLSEHRADLRANTSGNENAGGLTLEPQYQGVGIPFPGQDAPSPYSGLLSLADDNSPARGIGVMPESQRLAASSDYPSIDFTLRQEVLQKPEIAASIEGFRSEAARLQKIKENAISPQVRDKAAAQLGVLQGQFADTMRGLGISDAADAHGLNRPLYETGNGTRLPIQSTFSPLADRIARQRAANQQRLQGISQATTVDEAIQAASQQP